MYAESKENYLMMGLNPFLFSVTYFLLKYYILEKGHGNHQKPIIANHEKLFECCRIKKASESNI